MANLEDTFKALLTSIVSKAISNLAKKWKIAES